jgi:hypothetical protein
VHAPDAWVQKAFGGQPDEPQLQEAWEQGVRQAARYRIQYDITDPDDPLGPKPEQRDQHLDWRRAHEAVDRTDRRLGREAKDERGVDLGIEL